MRHHVRRKPDPYAAAKNPFGYCLGLIVCVLFGSLISIWGLWAFFQGEASKTWRPVEGRVIESEVEDYRGNEGKKMYSAQVKYEYEYLGKIFKGSKVTTMDTSSSDYGVAQRVVDQYTVGSPVQVFVNPADHSSAVLETGGTWFPLVFVAFGGIFAFAGIVGLMNAPNTIANAKARMEAEQGQQAVGIPPTDDLLGKL